VSESPPAAARTPLWEDFLDVFIAPVELFRRRADGKFGHALLVLMALTALAYFGTHHALQPISDAEYARKAATAGNLTPEQAESSRKIVAVLGPVFLVLGMGLAAYVLGAVVWLTTRAVGGAVSYVQGATIATFALFPRVLETVSMGVQALLMDESKLVSHYSVSAGLGRLVDPVHTNPIMLTLLGRVEFFTLWVTVLVAIGLRQMGRMTTGQAAAAAGIVWLVGAIPQLLQALRAG